MGYHEVEIRPLVLIAALHGLHRTALMFNAFVFTVVLIANYSAAHAWVNPKILRYHHGYKALARRSICKQPSVQFSVGATEVQNSTRDMVLSTINETLHFDLVPSISSISGELWDSCPAAAPFLSYAWLRCLEDSNCVSSASGWVPQHVSIRIGGMLAGFMPLYLKGHSFGEFVFDQAWADAAYQNRIDYYPKLLSGSPFTPVTGERILWLPDALSRYSGTELSRLRTSVGNFLSSLAKNNNLSSVHINFMTDHEAQDIAGILPYNMSRGFSKPNPLIDVFHSSADGFVRRTSLQYHWHNRNPKNDNLPYRSFEEYLNNFKSKRRISIRRERESVLKDQDIRIDVVRGFDIREIPGLTTRMYEIYVSTIEKMSEWGRQYLTLDFFEKLVASDFCEMLCFFCARRRAAGDQILASDVFAGTINVVFDGVFYGRYWGCVGKAEEAKNLHFETCYWSAIEFCIDNGVKRMEPGAGGGDYKWARGFDPEIIHSVHYMCHAGLRQAIRDVTEKETAENIKLARFLKQRRKGPDVEMQYYEHSR